MSNNEISTVYMFPLSRNLVKISSLSSKLCIAQFAVKSSGVTRGWYEGTTALPRFKNWQKL